MNYTNDVAATDSGTIQQYNKLRDEMGMTGIVVGFGSSVIPDGWLLCDGSAISRTVYADLFGILGTTFGVGDGSTTFNLPDCKGRIIVVKGTSYNLGTIGGNTTITLVSANMPAHAHSITAGGSHTHASWAQTFYTGAGADVPRHTSGTISSGVGTDSNVHNHGAVTGYSGSGTSFSLSVSCLVCNFIIKV
jgi:microcystin-dependent protein